MDVGTALSFAQTIFAALQSSELREIFNVQGRQSELEELEKTVKIINNVLLDAENKAKHEDLSNNAQGYIDDLRNAVYDADDLLDEFATLAQRKDKEAAARSFIQKGNVYTLDA